MIFFFLKPIYKLYLKMYNIDDLKERNKLFTLFFNDVILIYIIYTR